ncbi:rna pseudouridine synthase superfamily protein [Cystoisospora suis]|uniref:Rna pseudouridine synthase superfamily protein n=1 Tax=Cystoisospora suis TaxID=483139 RepID=A0A2C6L7R5_9APIC|nr:rna pseudouridine synthase superfamily protein [Cystoisospora suis]
MRRTRFVRLLLWFVIFRLLLFFPPLDVTFSFVLRRPSLGGPVSVHDRLVLTARCAVYREIVGYASVLGTWTDKGHAGKNIFLGSVPLNACKTRRPHRQPPCTCASTFSLPSFGAPHQKEAGGAPSVGPGHRKCSYPHTTYTAPVSRGSHQSTARLDIVLSDFLGISRTLAAAHFIRGERVWVDDKLCVSPGKRVKAGSKVSFLLACVCCKGSAAQGSERAREETESVQEEKAAPVSCRVAHPVTCGEEVGLGVIECENAKDTAGSGDGLMLAPDARVPQRSIAVKGTATGCEAGNGQHTNRVSNLSEVAALIRCRLHELVPDASQNGEAKQRGEAEEGRGEQPLSLRSDQSSQWGRSAPGKGLSCSSQGRKTAGLPSVRTSSGIDASISRIDDPTAASFCGSGILDCGVQREGNSSSGPSWMLRDSSALVVLPDERKLQILYEDKDIMVVNKPAGLLTHPPALTLRNISQANANGSVVHRLFHHFLVSKEPFPETLKPLLERAALLLSGTASERAGSFLSLHRDDGISVGQGATENSKPPTSLGLPLSCLGRLQPASLCLPEIVSRPHAIVHRLDIGTTGVLVVAKTLSAATSLRRQWSQRRVVKGYVGVCTPEMTAAQTVDAAIGRHPKIRAKMQAVGDSADVESGEMGDVEHPQPGYINNFKTAVSIFRPLGGKGGWGVFGALALTGRTHQIRAHLEFIGHPLLGDTVYGSDAENSRLQALLSSSEDRGADVGNSRSRKLPDRCRVAGQPGVSERTGQHGILRQRPLLHAYLLRFSHPTTDAALTFKAPLPGDLLRIMKHLGVEWKDGDSVFESMTTACGSWDG